jgi:hypothetical protein
MLSGTAKGQYGRSGRKANDNIFQRVHPDGFFPAQLVGVRWSDRAIPAHPVDHLGVEQMDVNGVGVNAIMGNLPYAFLPALH